MSPSMSATSPTPALVERLVAPKPDIVFHLAGIVSGEAEADFELGYRVNLDGTRALFDAIRLAELPAARRLHLVDRRVRGAVPGVIPDDFHQTPLTSYGTQKLIGEADPRRLYAARLLRRHRHPAADHLRAAGQAQQGGVGLLLRHHPRAAERRGGGAAGAALGRAHPCQPALGGRIS